MKIGKYQWKVRCMYTHFRFDSSSAGEGLEFSNGNRTAMRKKSRGRFPIA